MKPGMVPEKELNCLGEALPWPEGASALEDGGGASVDPVEESGASRWLG